MGYRLEIRKITGENEIKNIFYGTKLYGYVDYTDLLSAIYLYSIGKIENEVFENLEDMMSEEAAEDYIDIWLQFKDLYFKEKQKNKELEELLKEKCKVGAKVSKENFPTDYPVKLVFNNTKSIDILIKVLKKLKSTMEDR